MPHRRDADRFIAFVAHEMRTPLATILGYEELLSDGMLGQLTGDSVEGLVRIRSAATQLLALAHGLEAVAGVGGGPRLATVDLATVLAQVVQRMTPEGDARGIKLRFRPAATLQAIADPDHLRYVLELLLLACLKTGTGGSLDATVEATADGAPSIRFSGAPIERLEPLADSDLDPHHGDASAADAVLLRFGLARRAAQLFGAQATFEQGSGGVALVLALRPTD